MDGSNTPDFDDLEAFGRELSDLTEKLQGLLAAGIQGKFSGEKPQFPDPDVIGEAFRDWWASVLEDPERLANMQKEMAEDFLALNQSLVQSMGEGAPMPQMVQGEAGDRRFKDEDWTDNPFFSYLRQSYLIANRWANRAASGLGKVDPQTRLLVEFYTRQYMDALAPTNYLATNPAALRATQNAKGRNLLQGLQNLVKDLEFGGGELKIRQTAFEAFTVGENIATTPGKVVFENEMMQLIQYAPTTKTVARRPLVIFPPWINKFYILDLDQRKSFIRWAVDQGLTVFVVSWVNPDESLAHKDFVDYMTDGILTALDAVEKATGEQEFNVIGYCIGGTLLAATLAYMAQKGDTRINSATFFTALVDFAEAGELKVFIDDKQLQSLEKNLDEQGYLDGSVMSTAFNLLRANDLIWSYVVRGYLLGKDPAAFDILYWNSDSTRMPAMMHKFYLRNMYLENNLSKPGGITLDGVAIDLGKVKTPCCFVSTREDHIAPWKSTYSTTQLFSGPCKFILGGSGHIAGVINPEGSNKYGYWTCGGKNPPSPDDWLAGAKQHEGSWWPEWKKWIARKSGGQVPARIPGKGKLKPIEDAPGSYVKSSRPGNA